MAFILYYALLAVWPLLLWPALRLGGWYRVWLCIVAVAGLLATVHEIRMLYWSPSAIRLDIVLIAMALGAMYATAAAVMFLGTWRKSAAALGVVLAIVGGGMSYIWIEASRESKRLSKVFEARNVLLFEAKFRSPDAYASYFEMSGAAPTSLPAGHWLEMQSGGYFSRLIVNPQGRAWAFFRCGETECEYTSVDPGVQVDGDPAEKRWTVTLKPPVGVPVIVRLAQSGPGRLTIEGQGQPTTFSKVPPPIDPAPAQTSLIYLGPFSQMDCGRQHADVRQLWLWREDARLYAVGIFSVLIHGRHAGFVSPLLLGEGVRQGEAWVFEWTRNGRSWKASIALDGDDAMLRLVRDGGTPAQVTLAREAIFRDEAIELAPLTGKADWDHWFDIILVGHFSSGDVPSC